jgi:hypothetical protein
VRAAREEDPQRPVGRGRGERGSADGHRRVQREELERVGLGERHRPQDQQHGGADDQRRTETPRAGV